MNTTTSSASNHIHAAAAKVGASTTEVTGLCVHATTEQFGHFLFALSAANADLAHKVARSFSMGLHDDTGADYFFPADVVA